MIGKNDLGWLILFALLTVVLFANAVGGEFVYDDKRQIAANALIQDPALYGKALTNDVWAFKGDGTISASNYWRPTFTAWCIINFRLFGLNPTGWHLTNILLQIGVCALAFLLLRKWGLPQLVAGAIVLLFAVHPSHSESVAWISGSPDLLFGFFFLLSLWFAEALNDPERRARRTRNLALAVICYLVALGAKEIAILGFPIYFLIFRNAPAPVAAKGKQKHPARVSSTTRLNRSLLFFGAAVVYFAVRLALLGQLSRPAEGAAGWKSAVITAPSIFVFYLRQMLFPHPVGINYALRPLEQIGFATVVFPLLLSVTAVLVLWRLSTRTRVQRIGVALFALPLLAVFNVTAFLPEQIVHDRYLYLPLLGFLIVVIPALAELLGKAFGAKAETALLALSVALSIPLAVQTYLINRTWSTELALWQHAVTVDPRSGSNWSALGSELSEEGRYDEAIRAYDTSLAIRPGSIARIGRAQNLIRVGRLDEGTRELRAVAGTGLDQIDIYTLYQAFEGLAIAYQQADQLDRAEATLRDARERLPIYRAALTGQLAIVLYGENRKPEALAELEGAKEQARVELLPASKSVFLRLGMLYAEMGRTAEARANLQEYLNWTETTKDKETNAERAQAEELLRSLR